MHRSSLNLTHPAPCEDFHQISDNAQFLSPARNVLDRRHHGRVQGEEYFHRYCAPSALLLLYKNNLQSKSTALLLEIDLL